MAFDTITDDALLIALLIVGVAILYSAVGHGGASGYLAVMALMQVAPATMKPAALMLNIAVTSLVFWRLRRAGLFNARLFWPFALGSVPFAFLGGATPIGDATYKYIVAAALAVAALRLFVPPAEHSARRAPPPWLAGAIGAGLGYLSGITGVGGGIFLSPLLLLLRWADVRTAAAVSAAFIWLNSAAGLAGHALNIGVYPAAASSILWLVAATIGAAVGSELALRRWAPLRLRQLLSVLLLVAAGKLALTA